VNVRSAVFAPLRHVADLIYRFNDIYCVQYVGCTYGLWPEESAQ